MTTKTKTESPTVIVTLADFDSQEPFRVIRDGAIADFQELGAGDYSPRGMTPLLDATAQMIAYLDKSQKKGVVSIGVLLDRSGSMRGNEASVITGVNEFVAGMVDVKEVDPEADGKVLCVIFTDGLENYSKEVTREKLGDMVAEREKKDWTFIYLGANQDAWGEAGGMGYSGSASGQSVNFQSTPVGTANALRSTGNRAAHYLSDNAGAVADAAASPSRTITEDGTEFDQSGHKLSDAAASDVADAIKKAKSTTEGE